MDKSPLLVRLPCTNLLFIPKYRDQSEAEIEESSLVLLVKMEEVSSGEDVIDITCSEVGLGVTPVDEIGAADADLKRLVEPFRNRE